MSRKLSAEHKQKMLDARKAKKPIVKADPFTRHTIYLTGKEENGFDFFPAVRKALRSHYNYISGPKIENELANKKRWKDKEYCMAVIEKHFDVSYEMQPEKKKRKSSRKGKKPTTNTGEKTTTNRVEKQLKNDNTQA